MASVYYVNLDQQRNPFWHFLRDVGSSYGPHHPPAYSEQAVPNRHAEATESSREPSSAHQTATGPDQHDRQGTGIGSHARHGGCSRAGGCGSRRGHHCAAHPRHRGQWAPWWAPGPCHAPRGSHTEDRHRSGQDNPFDFNSFFENLQSQFPQLRDVLNGLGDSIPESNGRAVDSFTPSADIFDGPNQYIVHVSLPGAKKEDISIEYEAVNSTLHIAGVVHRPGVDEALSRTLVVSGRDREIGVFEREIRLGTRGEPANVDMAHITASLNDGILVLVLPKLADPEQSRKTKVPITQADTESKPQSPAETDTESLSDAMEFESVTEAGDQARATPPSPTVRDEEDEEQDYVAVAVD